MTTSSTTDQGASRTQSANDRPGPVLTDMHALANYLYEECRGKHRVAGDWLNRTAPIMPSKIRKATTAQLLGILIRDSDVMVIAQARDEIRRRWLEEEVIA